MPPSGRPGPGPAFRSSMPPGGVGVWGGGRPSHRRSRIPLAAVLVTAVLWLAACTTVPGSSSPTTTAGSPTTSSPVATTLPPGAGPTTTATSGATVLSSITAAVVAFEDGQGLPADHYAVRGVTLSTTDPTWAKFQIDAAPGFQGTVQNGYGIAHDAGGWSVTGIGSSGVGCSGPHAVPAATLGDLGLTCP